MRTVLHIFLCLTFTGILYVHPNSGFGQGSVPAAQQAGKTATPHPTDQALQRTSLKFAEEQLSSATQSQELVRALAGIVPEQHVPLEISQDKRLIYTALEQHVNVGQVNQSLSDFLRTIADSHGIPVYLNALEIELYGVDPDARLDLQLAPMKLRKMLGTVLEPLELTYIVRNDLVEITSQDSADYKMVNEVYRLPQPLAGRVGEKLIEMIVRSVDSDSWMENGGNYQMMIVAERLLVVSAPTTTQYKIQEQFGKIVDKFLQKKVHP